MKIVLVATGGSIGSRRENGINVISDAAAEQIASCLHADKVFSELKFHSENIDLTALNRLRVVVSKALAEKPDGIVITHGTDTLAFTSAYLAYAFCDTQIPIVMCSANLPLNEPGSNGFDILYSAKMFLQSNRPGVYAICKNDGFTARVHHGARLLPTHLHDHYYHSIGEGSAFKDSGLMHGMNFDISDVKSILITPYVGMNYSDYNVADCAAIVHCAYHSGMVNTAALNDFAKAHADIPIMLTEGRKKYAENAFVNNVFRCSGITQTALYVKTLIGLKNEVKDLHAFVQKDACGDIVARAK